MTNIVCLLYVGWVTNYIANIYIKVPMPIAEKKLDGDKRGDTLRIIERLDRLESVVNQHIQGNVHGVYHYLIFLPIHIIIVVIIMIEVCGF
jgi:polypeptide N-acetylgalactosaminyltransferase